MNKISDLAPILTERPIVLVVEDRQAKEYLYTAWGAEQKLFTIITAGGRRMVQGIVEDFRKHGADTVFGLIDTDFDTPNTARWNTPNDPPFIFRTSYHETENMLLDWDALAGCKLNQQQSQHTATDIQGWAAIEAAKQPWWLACRKRLRRMQEAHGKDFPTAPAVDAVSSYQNAFDYVAQSDWCQDLQNRTTQILDQTALETELNDSFAVYDQQLTTGQWRTTFSGKEVFRHLLSRIYPVPRSVSREADVDLAISVAEWQRDNGRVPQEIVDLKDALKTRVGI